MKFSPLYTRSFLRKTNVNGLMYLYEAYQLNMINASTTYTKYKSCINIKYVIEHVKHPSM